MGILQDVTGDYESGTAWFLKKRLYLIATESAIGKTCHVYPPNLIGD